MQRDREKIRDISAEVYKLRLGKRGAASMLAKDGDGGVLLRSRAASYDATTVAYLTVIGLPIPTLP